MIWTFLVVLEQARGSFFGPVEIAVVEGANPLNTPNEQAGSPPVPQPVVQALTRAAIFLVATINAGSANGAAVRSLCGDLPALLRAVGFRDIEGNLSCVIGIGSDAWDRLFG